MARNTTAKRQVCFISQNARGLKSNCKIRELITSIKTRNVFAGCIQETWRTGKSTLELDGYQIITTGLDKRDVKSRRGEQGVAIVLSPDAITAWKKGGCVIHNDLGARVMAVRLMMQNDRKDDIGVFLVAAYAPVGNAKQNSWDEFSETLEHCINRKNPKDILILGCDANSSLGTAENTNESDCFSSIGKFGLPHQNRSGIRFNAFMEINSFTALTTRFQKSNYATWNNPRSKLPHQIDHFLCSKNDFYRFTDAGSIKPFVDSDHRAVMCKVRLLPNLKKTVSPRKRLSKLNDSALIKQEVSYDFCTNVFNNFQRDVTDANKYTKFAIAMDKAATNALPKKDRPQPGWFSANEDHLNCLIEARDSALSSKITRPTRSAIKRLKKARNDLKSAISKAKNDWISGICRDVNESGASRTGTKLCWDKVKVLRKGLHKPQPPSQRMMVKEDGTKCRSSDENADVFKKHFQKLYGRTPTFDQSVIDLLHQQPTFDGLQHPPSDQEIIDAAKHLKNKAPGESGLTPRMIKSICHDNRTFTLLRDIILDFWENELPPEQWETGLLQILPKKGDLSKPTNYRGIMLLEAVYKVAAKIVHSRLQPIVESLDHEAQCGFRPGRGCCDAVFSVKIAMKKRREHGKETWVLFLDLVKAFDRVPRELLWQVLHRFGVPHKLLSIIKSLHKSINVKFTVDDVTNEMNCTIGVKQGDILGPVLFTMYIAAIMISWRAAHNRPVCIFRTKEDFVLTGRRHNTKGEDFGLEDSEYADDTAVLFESRENVEEFTPLLIAHFQRFGMEVHTGDINQPNKPPKTEILFVAAPSIVYEDPASYDDRDLSDIKLDETHFIPVVDRFCYLGTILSRDCKDMFDITARITKASNAFGSLRKSIFTNKSISISVKSAVYECLILPILLYGAEAWCITEELFRMLSNFHNRCVRSICNVSMRDVFEKRLSTQCLLDRIGLKSIRAYCTKRQLRWAGHVARMGFERLPRKVLSSWVPSKRPIGAPEFTYGRSLYKGLRENGIDKVDWYVYAMNRGEWKQLIDNI